MKEYAEDFDGLVEDNPELRQSLYTAKNHRLVIMALMPSEKTGEEVQELDRFFRVEEGFGEAILDGARTPIQAGSALLVPAGTKHSIVNTGTGPLKLYAIHAPRPRSA